VIFLQVVITAHLFVYVRQIKIKIAPPVTLKDSIIKDSLYDFLVIPFEEIFACGFLL